MPTIPSPLKPFHSRWTLATSMITANSAKANTREFVLLSHKTRLNQMTWDNVSYLTLSALTLASLINSSLPLQDPVLTYWAIHLFYYSLWNYVSSTGILSVDCGYGSWGDIKFGGKWFCMARSPTMMTDYQPSLRVRGFTIWAPLRFFFFNQSWG